MSYAIHACKRACYRNVGEILEKLLQFILPDLVKLLQLYNSGIGVVWVNKPKKIKTMTNNTSEMACVRFGQFLLHRRRVINKKAREVAEEVEMLASNYSKIETGTARPPQDREKLKRLGRAVGLHVEDDWTTFNDLAAKANNSIAPDLVELIGANDLMPRFLRTLNKRQITEKELQEIIDKLRE